MRLDGKKADEENVTEIDGPGQAIEPDGPEVETLEEFAAYLRDRSPNGHRITPFEDWGLMENLRMANATYNSGIPGEPGSERRVFGWLFTLGKRLVRRVTGWYVVPAVDNQLHFNAHITRSVNEMKRYLDHLQINEDILSTIMHRDLALLRSNVLFLNRYVQRLVHDLDSERKRLRASQGVSRPVAGGESGQRDNGDSNGEDFIASLDILTLEQRVHGSTRMVQDRQRVYLKYMRGCRNVLCVGCGRGEFLQLLSREGIPATGTDTNQTLVNYCRDHGQEVTKADPMEFLESLDDGSLDGIILSRFAGHQSPARLIRMVKLCSQKLCGKGILIIETPNPFSLYALASYEIDDGSYFHPLHPESLRQICMAYAFVEPEVIFLNPLPPEEHLEEMDLSSRGILLDTHEQELFHQVNHNFSKINRLLFSHRDCALVTHRGCED